MITIKTNRLTGFIFLILGIFIWLVIPSQIPTHEKTIVTAQYLPRIIAIIMILGSSILILRSVFFHKEDVIEVKIKDELRTVLLMALLLIYIVIIEMIGFLIGSIIVSCALLFFYGSKNWKYYLCIVGFVVGIYLMFTYLFNVQFP